VDVKFQELIKGIRQSDSASFKTLFELLTKSLHYFIFVKVRNSEAAKDIVQDTFIRIWETRHQLNEDLSLKSYAYKIADNLALNHLRHNKVISNFHQNLELEPLNEDTPHTLLESSEFHESFLHAIEQLPTQTRIVFLMSRTENLSYNEIAERLGISIKTVESHIGKALKLLRIQLISLH
jgi:RNA polymerase sigma-70 factor (ECF subfamily)